MIMKQQLKWMFIVVGVCTALVATAFSASATAPRLAGAELPAASHLLRRDQSALACTKMQAGDVAWVTLTEDGDIDEQVESYESGTSLITPVFEYNCVPRSVTIVTIFSLEGEPVFSDKESLRSSNSEGLYGYPLGTTDDSPLDDGEWGVEFYNNKTLLTDSSVTIGEGGNGNLADETVTVEGVVTDKKSRKPIKGAVILILQPGVTVEDWVADDQPDEDVYTGGKTDSKGRFTLENPLEREVEYSIIVVAKSYKPLANDGFMIDAEEEDPVQLTIKMTK
jgi:hypothetical protein